MDCIFCKIIKKEIPSQFVHETENAIVIRDIQPQAKKHYLVIPKKHVRSLEEVFSSGSEGVKALSELYLAASQVVQKEGLLPGGFRSVINTNADGGQTVYHLHLHLLGGEKLKGTFA